MAFQSARSELVTRPTPLATFRNATLPVDAAHPAVPRWPDSRRDNAQDLALTIYKNLAAVESEWRAFEAVAECMPFQTYEWLAAWQRHVGLREGVLPAIAVGRFADGKTAIILPLAVSPRHSVRRLCWFGQELCDYNAPLLARDFSQRVTPDRFLALWQELRARLQADPELRHDWIDFEKMPETIGAQINPFTHLAVILNANSAHITQLGDDWETFYRDVRSSATRRRDRAKRKRMAEFGDIRFVTADARYIVAAKEADFCAQGHFRRLLPARLPRIFSRFRLQSADTAFRACQPPATARAQARDQAIAAGVVGGLPRPFHDRAVLASRCAAPLHRAIRTEKLQTQSPVACVMGDMDLLQPLAMDRHSLRGRHAAGRAITLLALHAIAALLG